MGGLIIFIEIQAYSGLVCYFLNERLFVASKRRLCIRPSTADCSPVNRLWQNDWKNHRLKTTGEQQEHIQHVHESSCVGFRSKSSGQALIS